MSIFTFFMDVGSRNEYAVMRAINAPGTKVINFPQFCFNILRQIVFTNTEYKAARSTCQELQPNPHPPLEGTVDLSNMQHVLLENITGKQILATSENC